MDRDEFNRITRALADPTRMEIFERIASEPEVRCAILAREFTVTQPTISHHIKELSTAGLIKSRRESKYFFFWVNVPVWTEYLAELNRRVPVGHQTATG